MIYIHTYIHAYIHTYMHTYIHTFIHSYIQSNRFVINHATAFRIDKDAGTSYSTILKDLECMAEMFCHDVLYFASYIVLICNFRRYRP